MRRFLCSLIGIAISFCAVSAYAQNVYSAYTLANQNPEGTARSVSMGNAFTALGADLGAISINPASSAVYKYNEFSFTPAINFNHTSAGYGSNISTNRGTFGIANVGFVGVSKTGRKAGLVSMSFGMVYNKQNNFSTRLVTGYASTNESYIDVLTNLAKQHINYGFDMDNNDTQNPFRNYGAALWPTILAWNASLIDTTRVSGANDIFYPTANVNATNYASNQYYRIKSYGSTGVYNFNFGMNFENLVYVGANLGLVTVWNKLEETYSEENTTAGTQDFNNMRQFLHQTTSGTGFNLKIGAIVTPTPNFRIGASVQTPTWYYLTDKYYYDLSSRFSSGYRADLGSPEGSFDYRVTTPFRYSAGVAFVLPMGTISADYEGVDYSSTKLNNRSGHSARADFSADNSYMKNNLTRSDNIRVGIEIMPVSLIAIRGGFQYSNSGIKQQALANADGPLRSSKKVIENYIGSVGLGLSSPDGFFFDIAYAQSIKKTPVLSDNNLLAGGYALSGEKLETKRNNWKLLMTFGWRF